MYGIASKINHFYSSPFHQAYFIKSVCEMIHQLHVIYTLEKVKTESGFHSYGKVNPANKETLHSFKGQQLENKSLYRFVIYIRLWIKFLALI